MNAKAILALCLLTGLSSAYFGKEFHAKATSANAQARSAQNEARKLQDSLIALEDVLRQDTSKQLLQETTAKALVAVYNLRSSTGVNVNQLTPGKLGAGMDTPVNELAEDVPGSNVKTVKVNMVGAYTSYAGLVSYFEQLQSSGPVALTRLKVSERSFEASIRVFGTLE